jgi:hypothetical protein
MRLLLGVSQAFTINVLHGDACLAPRKMQNILRGVAQLARARGMGESAMDAMVISGSVVLA